MAYDILIVDDEADIRSLLAGILEDEGYDTRQARNSDEALEAVDIRRPGLVILDIWLENSTLDGLQILERLSAEHPDIPVIMISGHGTIETAVSAIKIGAYDFIEKPFETERLLLQVGRALEAVQLRRENAELRARSDVPRLGGCLAAIARAFIKDKMGSALALLADLFEALDADLAALAAPSNGGS